MNSSLLQHDKLSSGLSYYVQSCIEPEQRATLLLVVKVGSVYETEDERGVAHLCEHMAFRCTKAHCDEDFAVIRSLESMGLRFGACQNAHTNYEETVYQLIDIPVDKDANGVPNLTSLRECICILREWMHNIIITDKGLSEEIPIVLNELQERQKEPLRSEQNHVDSLLQGTSFENRQPIGTKKNIKEISADTLREFYRKWYHPSRMAIIAVGDFDADTVVSLITKEMAPLEAVSSTCLSPDTPILKSFPNPQRGLRCHAFKDKIPQYILSIDCIRKRKSIDTVDAFHEKWIESVFIEALNIRFCSVLNEDNVLGDSNCDFFSIEMLDSDDPFPSELFCGLEDVTIDIFPLVSCLETMNISIVTSGEVGFSNAIARVLWEVERVHEYGFNKDELTLARRNVIASAMNISESVNSRSLTEKCKLHFLRGDLVLDVSTERSLIVAAIEGVQNIEVDKYVRYFNWNQDCFIRVAYPDFLDEISEDYHSNTENQIHGAVSAVTKRSSHFISPPVIANAVDIQLPPLPPPGPCISRRYLESIDSHEGVLANGMRVCVRAVEAGAEKEILFGGVARGGFSEIPATDRISALWSSEIIEEIGLMGFNPTIFNRMLAGVSCDVSTSMTPYTRGISGSCRAGDIKMLLHMVHLLFTRSAAEDRDFDERRLRNCLSFKRHIVFREATEPSFALRSRIQHIISGGSPYWSRITPEDVDAFDIEKALSYFRRCFARPSDFSLVLVGRIDDIDELFVAMEAYLGSIPTCTAHDAVPFPPIESLNNIAPKFPSRIVYEKLSLPEASTSAVHLAFHVHFPRRKDLLLKSILLTHCFRILETKLVTLLRFTLGSTYSVDMYFDSSFECPSFTSDFNGILHICFSCPPGSADFLVKKTLQLIHNLRQPDSITEFDVSAHVSIDKHEEEAAYRDPTGILNRLVNSYQSQRYRGDIGTTYTELKNALEHVWATLCPEQLITMFRESFSEPNDATSSSDSEYAGGYVVVISDPLSPIQRIVNRISENVKHQVLSRWLIISGSALAAAFIVTTVGRRLCRR